MPTEEQLKSRETLKEFMERVARPIEKLGARIKSDWFGRPDSELKGWIARGQALAEIEGTTGYQLIMTQTDKEITWAREQLELGELDVVELRAYLRSLRFLKEFILTTNKNADIASTVLAGRPRAIEKEVFVRNAQVRG